MSHYYSQSPSHSLWGLPYSQQNLLWADNNNCRWYYAEFQVVAIMAISVTNFVPVRLHAWAEEIRRSNADQPSPVPTGWHVYVCAGASLRIIVTSIAGSVVHCIGVVDVSAVLLIVCASLSGSSPGEILCCSCIAVYIASESSTSVPCSHRVYLLIHRVNFCVVRAFQCSISSEICDGCSVLFIYITIGWKYSHRVELMCCGVVVIVGNGTYRAFGIGFTVCICWIYNWMLTGQMTTVTGKNVQH